MARMIGPRKIRSYGNSGDRILNRGVLYNVPGNTGRGLLRMFLAENELPSISSFLPRTSTIPTFHNNDRE